MSNVCAYCRKPGKLTREHLYPQFLHRWMGPSLGYNESADKVIPGERVIRDVCAACNNGILAKLDGYGKKYFESNNLDVSFIDEQVADVQYDYDPLLRWILKVSYNSSRTMHLTENPFASLIPYILTGTPRPKQTVVMLLLEVIRGRKLSPGEAGGVSEQVRSMGHIPCYIVCSGRLINRISEVPCQCRHFQVNAHRFTVLIFPYDTRPVDANRYLEAFQDQLSFSRLLDPASAAVKIPISSRDIIEIHRGPNVSPLQRLRQMGFIG